VRTIKFHKTECGVEVMLNVLLHSEVDSEYLSEKAYNTDFFEIIVFKKVEGSLILNQKKHELRNNSVVFISPFQKRKWLLTSSQVEFTTLIFKEEFLNDFFSDKLFPYKLLFFFQYSYPLVISLENTHSQSLCGGLMEIKHELTFPMCDSHHIIRSLLYYHLQKLNREYATTNKIPLSIPDNNFAYLLKQLLENHIRQKHRIDDYTSSLKISRITLNKAVQKQFNVSTTHLIKNRLLAEVKNELLFGGKNINEIANILNFSEPQHMIRFFKNNTGQTPTEFIAANQ